MMNPLILLAAAMRCATAPNLDLVLDEVRRVLKPGGVAAFLDFSKPAATFRQEVQYWILKIWGGFWGLLLHRNADVHGYIAESLRLFPDRLRLRELLRQKGFIVIASRRHFAGFTESLLISKS